jgi:uncharacterized LabA/DUF88 family protein
MGTKETNYAFIDSQNLNLSIRAQGWKLDLKRFRKFLDDKHKVKKAYLFMGYIPENKQMYGMLKDFGYTIVFKPISKTKSGDIKGNVDAELVLHCMIQFMNYEKAVVVTGDGDFYCLIKHLIQKNKFKKLIVPNSHKYSGLLKEFTKDKIDFMNNLRKKLEYKNEGRLHKD